MARRQDLEREGRVRAFAKEWLREHPLTPAQWHRLAAIARGVESHADESYRRTLREVLEKLEDEDDAAPSYGNPT